ncbi:S-layer family protein [Allocoleopsis sp.]|uniref:S-layer family protein n=1 Tax=Allocoleopsis sp. TaxID=3088169 RepID=UPI002FD65110
MVYRKKVWHRCLSLARCFAIAGALTEVSLAIAFTEKSAIAQIVSDTTLGAQNSIVTPSVNVGGQTADRIDGGAARGTNLFHSFSQFNIGDGQRVYFFNPSGIENILSRVTGNNVSNILGTLGVLGNANLFLINPNGIVFGPNARLDIAGSFVASTANSLVFDNGFAFSATTPQTPPLLTINVPIGLQYGGNAGSIQVQRSRLRVPNGETLALVGGLVSLDGADVESLGGRVELTAVGGSGIVGLSVNNNDLRLSVPDTLLRTDVSLTNGAFVDVTAGGGGSIAVNSRNLALLGGSSLLGGIGRGLGSPDTKAGDINVNATGEITVEGSGSIDNSVLRRGRGKGGDINITSESLVMTNGALLKANTEGQGDGGNVNILARERISLDGVGRDGFSTAISVQVGGTGNGGNLNITTDSLSLTNGAQIGLATFGQGNVGNVNITAANTVSIDGVGSHRLSTAITNSVAPRAVGNGGVINIMTGSLSVTNGGRLFSSTFGQGNGGDMKVTARDIVSFDGVGTNKFSSAAVSQVSSSGVGNGGTIEIATRLLSMTNGAQLAVSSFGRGDAGNVRITAGDTVSLDGEGNNGVPSAILSSLEARGVGKGGNIDITTGSFSLSNRAQLFASTRGRGDAGRILVQAENAVSVANGSQIRSTVESGAVGNGEKIEIRSRSLSLTNAAQLSASTSGQGDAGNIFVSGVDSVYLSNSSISTAVNADAVGQGGNIHIQSPVLSLAEGSILTALSRGQGNAGNVEIDVADAIKLDNSQITVNKQGTQGNAGTLNVSARSILLDNQGKLTAVTESGNGGDIILQVQDLLLLRRGSTISTTAGTARAGGNGGNITIDADLIVAVPKENSDITANAFEGRGGNISITTQGIFGLQLGEQLTPLSDITASSEFGIDGVVEINTPDVDPSRGVAELPTNVVDPSTQLAQSCPGSGGATTGKLSKFIVTGSGGLPSSPSEPFNGSAVWHDLRPMKQEATNRSVQRVQPEESGTKKLVETQGWVLGANGEVILTASAPTVTPHNLQVTPIVCPDSKLPLH